MMIKACSLTPEAFAAFGQVLQGSGAETERQGFAVRMENSRSAARPNMTYMKLVPATGSIRIEALERHEYSNQTFIPLNGTRHLVAACPSTPNGDPNLSELRVFVAEGSQAVNYFAKVWHAPRMALSRPGEFIMFRWDDGSNRDTDLIQLEMALTVDRSDLSLT
jgi:ureidoglycolate lyase